MMMNLGLSMGAASAGLDDAGLALRNPRAASQPATWSNRYSPRACALIWAAAAAASWALTIGLGAGLFALGRLALG